MGNPNKISSVDMDITKGEYDQQNGDRFSMIGRLIVYSEPDLSDGIIWEQLDDMDLLLYIVEYLQPLEGNIFQKTSSISVKYNFDIPFTETAIISTTNSPANTNLNPMPTLSPIKDKPSIAPTPTPAPISNTPQFSGTSMQFFYQISYTFFNDVGR